MGERFTLLIRAFDADSTFLSYRWLDDPDNPVVYAVVAADRSRLLAGLTGALLAGDGEEQVRAAVNGPLTRIGEESEISRNLARGLIPAEVRAALCARAARGSVSVRITPSRSLARVPWELLAIDGDRRLIELAVVEYEPPAAIHVGRSVLPQAWPRVADRPVCYIVDPRLPAGAGLRQVLARPGGSPDEDEFYRRIESRRPTARSGIGMTFRRRDLREELHAGVSRLFYFGHVSSTLDQPGSSSLHLSDSAREWGLAEAMNNVHRPLSALDLFVGTAAPELGPEEGLPDEDRKTGAELWPMPPRVAMIACEGGADYRSSEIFGLVTSMFTAGAEVVTTTRWTLPTDAAFHAFAGVQTVPGPTVELALAVDYTHEQIDPVVALADWQRMKLAQWRADPGPATSPLTWAAIGSHVCAARAVHAPKSGSL